LQHPVGGTRDWCGQSLRQTELEERRKASRYQLTFEIKLESELNEFEPISGTTRDISTQGFYFGTSQRLSVGMKMWFSIKLPPWESTNAFIRGRARVTRVEGGEEESHGIGAVIEGYKFGKAESSH